MLLRKQILDGIKSGQIDLAFRRWTRPTVKTGGSLRTGAGMLRIVSVTEVDPDRITDQDAARAGLTLKELLQFLREKEEGDVYRVELGGFVPDPREVLREDDQLSDEDMSGVISKLDRLDGVAGHGPWTGRTLNVIADRPHVRAQDLADSLGVEKDVFKRDVSKLKALGLTISHSPGYELSPRGLAVLEGIRKASGR